jgi:hypothetical protein
VKKFLLLALLLSGCYVSKKLDSTATIRIRNNFEVTLESCSEPKYINYASGESYRSSFLEALESEMKENNLVSRDSGKTEYELEITQLRVEEDISTQTMNEENFELHGCGVYFKGVLYKNGELVAELNSDAGRSEDTSNNRTFWEWLFGLNKDNSEYHVKRMSSGICQKLSEKCGRHTCAVITKRIVKGK